MRYFFTAVMTLSAALTASSAYAQQPPGWQVCWGPLGSQPCAAAVPLDPWMMVAFAIFLGVALVWTQRRQSRFGTYLVVAGGLALAAVSSYQIREAGAPPIYDFDLTTPSGVKTKLCGSEREVALVQPGASSPSAFAGPPLSVYNHTSAPVQLVITPINGASITWPTPPDKCGTSLPPSTTCYLPCSSSPPPT